MSQAADVPPDTTIAESEWDGKTHAFNSKGDPWCGHFEVCEGDRYETGETEVICEECLRALEEEGY